MLPPPFYSSTEMEIFLLYSRNFLFIFINNKESEWVTELRGTIYMYSLISTPTSSEQEFGFIYLFSGIYITCIVFYILHLQMTEQEICGFI